MKQSPAEEDGIGTQMRYRHSAFPVLSLLLTAAVCSAGFVFNHKYPDQHNGGWLYTGFFGIVVAAILSVGLCLGAAIVASAIAKHYKRYYIIVVTATLFVILCLLLLFLGFVYVMIGCIITMPAVIVSILWVFLAIRVRKNLPVGR